MTSNTEVGDVFLLVAESCNGMGIDDNLTPRKVRSRRRGKGGVTIPLAVVIWSLAMVVILVLYYMRYGSDFSIFLTNLPSFLPSLLLMIGPFLFLLFVDMVVDGVKDGTQMEMARFWFDFQALITGFLASIFAATQFGPWLLLILALSALYLTPLLFKMSKHVEDWGEDPYRWWMLSVPYGFAGGAVGTRIVIGLLVLILAAARLF